MYSQALDKSNPKGRTRFYEHYKDARGRRKTVSVTLDRNSPATRREAARYLQKRIDEALGATDGNKMTFGTLAAKYAAYQRATYKASTCIQNEVQADVLMRVFGADTPLLELTAGRITEALNVTGQSPTWKNGKLRHLKALIRWGYEQEYVRNTDSIDRVKPWPEPPVRVKTAEKYMERDELKAVLDGMSLGRWARLTRFLALSGLRIGEAMALELADVDLNAKTLTVNKTYSLNARAVQTTKTTTSDRVLHLRPELLEILSTCCMESRKQALVGGYRPRLLFAADDGGYICYESFARYFREHTGKTIGRRLPVHALRHTYTSLMAEAGLPLDTISRSLGHADSKITKDIYLHVTEKMREKDAARLDAVSIF